MTAGSNLINEQKLQPKDVDLYSDFERWCFDAFSVIRRRHRFFCNLFTLMIPAEMPELTKTEDVRYLLTKLALHMTDQEVHKSLKKEIQSALTDTSRILDQTAHLIKRFD